MGEIWKKIDGYDCYFVSNYGRVKSIDRECRRRNGQVFKLRGKILSGGNNGCGYRTIFLRKNGSATKHYIHRLVACAFVPRPEGKDYVNHIDCNPGNNHADNLEWVTFRENLEYARALGRCEITDEWRRHLFEGQRKRFRPVIGVNIETGETLYSEWLNGVRKFGFNPPDVHRCCNGGRKHVGGYVWRYADEKHHPER